MELRYITIPADIDLNIGAMKWSFVHCMRHIIDTDTRFNSTGPGIRAGHRIMTLLEGKKPGDHITLDEADWKRAHEAVEAPGSGYLPTLAATNVDGSTVPFTVPSRAFLPYMDAVSD